MFFKKKSPKRLYYPTKSRWYQRPRKRKQPTLKRQRSWLEKTLKKIRNIFSRFTYVVVGTLIMFIVMAFLGFSSYFSITEIKIARESFYVDSQAILNQLDAYIGKNLVFFPRNDVVDTIEAHFPEFSSVKVSKTLPGTLTIHLENHPVVANIRAYYLLPDPDLNPDQEEVSSETNQQSSDPFQEQSSEFDEANEVLNELVSDQPVEQKGLLNQVGQVLFDQEENLELMTVTVNNLNQPLEDRQQLIDEEKMAAILGAIDYFNANFDLKIEKLEYLPTAREIHLTTDENITLWLSLEKDYAEQLDKLILTYKEAELDQEAINYIDLRVNGKVIYCPQGAECDPSLIF